MLGVVSYLYGDQFDNSSVLIKYRSVNANSLIFWLVFRL